jgi:hypothetical protein
MCQTINQMVKVATNMWEDQIRTSRNGFVWRKSVEFGFSGDGEIAAITGNIIDSTSSSSRN